LAERTVSKIGGDLAVGILDKLVDAHDLGVGCRIPRGRGSDDGPECLDQAVSDDGHEADSRLRLWPGGREFLGILVEVLV